MTLPLEKRLEDIIRADAWRMDVLRAVAALDLNDCWVGAGFVRSRVWDVLSGHADAFKIDDVDVIYHDVSDITEAREKEYDTALAQAMPGVPWSCKNQARMHQKAGLETPHATTEDGLRHWTETATAVAVRLDRNNGFHILSPFGLEDLFSMTVRPTPFFADSRRRIYEIRRLQKKWDTRWPSLRFE